METKISWPRGFSPSEAPLWVVNERTIARPLDVVWQWLTEPTRWPSYYRNATWIGFDDEDADASLRMDREFRWRTFGLALRSKVVSYDAKRALGWDATGFGVRAVHIWLLDPAGPGKTHVRSEEVQRGLWPSLLRRRLSKSISEWHERWIDGLETVSEGGRP